MAEDGALFGHGVAEVDLPEGTERGVRQIAGGQPGLDEREGGSMDGAQSVFALYADEGVFGFQPLHVGIERGHVTHLGQCR